MNNSPEIVQYLHCKKCMDELPDDVSPQEYKDLEVGFTEYGLEVWCLRHQERVVYLNLYDIWTLMNYLKKNNNNVEMPIFSLTPKDKFFPKKLIKTAIKGVFINPDEYWDDGKIPEPDHENYVVGCECSKCESMGIVLGVV